MAARPARLATDDDAGDDDESLSRSAARTRLLSARGSVLGNAGRFTTASELQTRDWFFITTQKHCSDCTHARARAHAHPEDTVSVRCLFNRIKRRVMLSCTHRAPYRITQLLKYRQWCCCQFFHQCLLNISWNDSVLRCITVVCKNAPRQTFCQITLQLFLNDTVFEGVNECCVSVIQMAGCVSVSRELCTVVSCLWVL